VKLAKQVKDLNQKHNLPVLKLAIKLLVV